MAGSVTDWVAGKIDPRENLCVVGRTLEDFLLVQYKDNPPFAVAVIGVQDVILESHVSPLFSHATKPDFVVNVPSKALWTGGAISLIHAAPAAFGTFGDIGRAASGGKVHGFRNKNWEFFRKAILQHTNVMAVDRLYDEVFEVHRRKGRNLKVALVEGYHVSAEDVRNARERFGGFDIAVKKTGYGSVTQAARDAAASMGAEAVAFKELMQRLAK